MLSVIIPAFNEEAMVPEAAKTIHGILEAEQIPHELVFIDDGSKDATWARIQAAGAALPCVSGVRFSRNFGKESAIYAGLSHSRGDCAVVIDCDLQHPPEKIVEMYRLWEQGWEIVEAVKSDRGRESALHRLCANAFYRMISRATKLDMSRASDFKLLDRKAVLALLNIRERNAFFRALSSWVGFRCTQIEFEVRPRTAGESKWSFWSLTRYALTNVTSFSAAPMQIITILGALTLVISLVLGIIALIQKFSGKALEGFTTVIILQTGFSSVIMLSIGILGYYIAQIYDEVKARPRYIVSELYGSIQK